jgi:hypothetical protein
MLVVIITSICTNSYKRSEDVQQTQIYLVTEDHAP